MKIGMISLGCVKNLVDSENIMGMLKEGGHTLVSNVKEAEVIIINTCGFIQPAKEEAIDTIFEMAKYKEHNLKHLIVTGCLAQRYRDVLIQDIPEIDKVITISEYDQLHEILGELLNQPIEKPYGKSERVLSSKPWSAYLKIAEGCVNKCTYCAIPLIRGDHVTYPMEDLVEQAKQLAAKGVKELVLIAQDTTRYGYELEPPITLLQLLQAIHEIEGFHWIRVLYMYPDEISDELIEGMAKLEKVIPYFDIPMQHANDRMLKLMNRRGSKEEVLRLINKIRNTFEDPTLRTTYIVGFPSESEADFEELVDFVEEVKWDRMGAFTYSPEEDTKAYEMVQDVSEEEKQRRLDIIMRKQAQISYQNHQRFEGKTIEVLVESMDYHGVYRGRSKACAPDEADGIIIFNSEKKLELGSFVKVLITKADVYDLHGEYVC